MKCSVTVRNDCEVLVCGSTLYAIDTALNTALGGRPTVLAMERTNPFIECICALRSHLPETDELSQSPTLMAILDESDHLQRESGRIYFNPHRVALKIEDLLIEAGVTFYYNAMPVAALMDGARVSGAVFGGKPGLFAVESSVVVDCTLSAVIAKTAGAPMTAMTGPTRMGYSVELQSDQEPAIFEFSQNGISGRIDTHRFFADFVVSIDDPATGPLRHAHDFARVYATVIDVLDGHGLTKFRGADVYFSSGEDLVGTERGSVIGIKNLFAFSPMALESNCDGQLIMTDPLALHRRFPEPGRISVEDTKVNPHADASYRMSGCGGLGQAAISGATSFVDPGFHDPGSGMIEAEWDRVQTVETDVLIAGCGTSGVGAAYRTGQLGLQPLCIDNGLEIGGTNTIGGVTNLWFGNPTKAFKSFYRDCGAANDGLNASSFFRALQRVGAIVLPGTPICGTGYSDHRLDCAFVISPDGLVRIKANGFVDATGDGSLAAWSGREYTFGSERDGVSSWGSFGNFVHNKPEAARQFLSMVDERSPRDTTRFIVAMRRCLRDRFEGEDYVHPAFYVAPRTGRHVSGQRTVTYLDVLAGRRFSDGILRAKSNIDTKGTETSNAYKAGFYPYERLERFEVTIPYSSLIPLGTENLIIVGKAYSITNDALTMARMQRDLFVLGMVAAEAVQLSKESNAAMGDVCVETLQARLIELGALERDDVAADDLGFGESAEAIVDRILGCDSLDDAVSDSAKLLLLGKESVMPVFEQKQCSMTPVLARLFCFWQVDEGVEFVRTDLQRSLAGPGLPLDVYASDHNKHLLPDHGFAPLPVLQLNNLALAGDSMVSTMISAIADRFNQATAYQATLWAYAFGVAYAGERAAAEAVTSSLSTILRHPVFTQLLIPRNGDLRECSDIKRERLTYLRLCLARALARCGSTEGLARLVEFLDEARVSFAVNARDELIAVTGQNFGVDREQWTDWIRRQSNTLTPTPVTVDYQ